MRRGGMKIEVKISKYKFNCDPQLTNAPVTSHGRGHKKNYDLLCMCLGNILRYELKTENSR